jgi:hypothetical protein
MHAATLLLPILAVLAQAAPNAAPKTDDYAAMPGSGQGQAQARAHMRAAGLAMNAPMYVVTIS